MKNISSVSLLILLITSCAKVDLVKEIPTSKKNLRSAEISGVTPITIPYSCFDWGSATEVSGYNLSGSLYNFQLNGNLTLTMQIDTYELGGGPRPALGYVTNLSGVSTYQVNHNPTGSNSALVDITYTFCSKPSGVDSCQSLCCEIATCSISGYLYKNGTNEDGSPRFYLYKTIQQGPVSEE